MDLKHLRYFARIVELESITAAAQSLFVAQPSLSAHVSNLEAELGTKLLNRSPQGTRPTAEGELLYRYATSILRQFDEIGPSVKRGLVNPAGHVSLGLASTIAKLIGGDLVDLMLSSNIVLEVVEASNAQLVQMLRRQQLDVAIVADVVESPAFVRTPLLEEELVLASHDGWVPPRPIDIEMLAELPLVIPSFPNGVRVKVESACVARGLSYRVAVETASVWLMLEAVRRQAGHAVVPASAAALDAPGVRFAPFAGRPLWRVLYSCVSSASAGSSACQLVLQRCEMTVRKCVSQERWPTATLLTPARSQTA